MKHTIIGGFLVLGGCIIFSCCTLYLAFQGRIPSDVQGEKLLSIILMIAGVGLMVYGGLNGKPD